ncbi:CWF19-like protein 2 isoform X2 [Rhinoraja longicauda]
MAEYGGRFESQKSIEEGREFKRSAREEVVAKARAKYEKEEKQKQLKRLRGEDTWMLPDVNERIDELSEEHSVKSKKKKKKSKKDKKVKKRNKSKEKTDTFSDSSSSSELKWVESTGSNPDSIQKPWKIKEEQLCSSEKTGSVQREEWMTLDFMSLKSISTSEIRAGKQKEKEIVRERAQGIEQAEIDKRELNPFWKNGGTGLPSAQSDSKETQKAALVEDGGLSWLRRSFQRMKEQAEWKQCQVEDVIAERYGSVEIFQEKLQAAEKVVASKRQKDTERRWRGSGGKTRNWTSDHSDRRKNDSGRGQNRGKVGHGQGDSIVEREKTTGNLQDQFKWKKDKERHELANRCRDKSKSHEREVEIEHDKDKLREYRIHEEKHKETQQKNSYARGLGSNCFHERREDKSFPFTDLKSKFMKPDDFESKNSKWGIRSPSCSNRLSESQPFHSSSFQKPDHGSDNISSWSRSNSGECSSQQPTSLPHQRIEEMPNPSDERTETKPGKNSPVQKADSEGQHKSSTRAVATIEEPLQPLSEDEMNKLGAKVIKAELMGNMPIDENREVVLVRTDPSGRVWPVGASTDSMIHTEGKKKRQTIETHHEGERIRYFQDDDNLSLQDLVRQEKMTTAEDQNERFSRMASKFMEKMDRDYYTLDDMFVSQASRKEKPGHEHERQRSRAIQEHKHWAGRMEKCRYCFDNPELPKHLIIAIGVKVYLCLPNYQSMTEGHCLIVPLQHHTAGTILDEDIWEEMQLFRKTLVKMLADKGLDCVFFETHMRLKKRFHMVYECIPLPKELGDMAPIYFKKAIMEADEEWAMNKKLVDISNRDIRRAVPKGLPYFSVDFGLQGGFAHIIENEDKFPFYFGKEIVGGMLDLEPRRWRKPHRENFDDQRKKVLQFSQWWKPYDCTNSKHKE